MAGFQGWWWWKNRFLPWVEYKGYVHLTAPLRQRLLLAPRCGALSRR